MRGLAAPLLATLILLALAVTYDGISALGTALVLAVLELSLSFDNAVVNAAVLRTMSPAWQRAFLTVGILVAVFVVRLAMPLIVVSADAATPPWHVARIMINDPHRYAVLVTQAKPPLAAFGATFLCLVAASFFAERRAVAWLAFEGGLARLLGSPALRVATAAGLVVAAGVLLGAGDTGVAVGLLAGLALWSILHQLQSHRRAAEAAVTGGFVGFLALEALDASMSVDGVIGAFALTTDVVVMAIGLGIGAIFVRSLTVTFARSGRVRALAYLEHAAYYSIALLGVLLAISRAVTVPDWASSVAELSIVGAAVLASHRAASPNPAVHRGREPVPATLASGGLR